MEGRLFRSVQIELPEFFLFNGMNRIFLGLRFSASIRTSNHSVHPFSYLFLAFSTTELPELRFPKQKAFDQRTKPCVFSDGSKATIFKSNLQRMASYQIKTFQFQSSRHCQHLLRGLQQRETLNRPLFIKCMVRVRDHQAMYGPISPTGFMIVGDSHLLLEYAVQILHYRRIFNNEDSTAQRPPCRMRLIFASGEVLT